MTRAIYRCLLFLHPPRFRRDFARDMLWLYDETAPAGVAPLFLDALASLARQWFLRTGSWKLALAILGALFQITIGGAVWFSIGRFPQHASLDAAPHPELDALMRIGALTAVALFAAVIFLTFWFRKLATARKPSHAVRRPGRVSPNS